MSIIRKLLFLFLLITPALFGQVSIATQNPYFGWQVIPGATRTIHAVVTNGTTNQVTWSYVGTGGATATLTPSSSPNISGAWVDVTLGMTGSSCTNTGTLSAPVLTSSTYITLTGTSVDDNTKSVSVPIYVCNPAVSVYVAPFNLRLYSGQKADLQSWVEGAVNDNVTWSITSQPSGGNGVLADTSNRDTVFSAAVAGSYTVTATSVADGTKSASATLSVDTVGMPSYSLTPNHTVPVDCSLDTYNTGNVAYDVGPTGHTYTTIASAYVAINAYNTAHSAPANSTPAGTTLQLYNVDTTGLSPTHYTEYLRIDGQGTQTKPIRIVGCPDAYGNEPVIDGLNATAYSPTDNSVGAQIAGLYQIGIHHSSPFAVYPTITSPSYIIIEGLAFRNAYQYYPTTTTTANNYYTPGSPGTLTQWNSASACIRPYEANHLTIRGNDLEDCSEGTLVDFNATNGWGGYTGVFDMEGNYFTNLGNASPTYHMAYVQALFQVIQFNIFDQLKSGSSGGELKMRGVGEVVRYNFMNTSVNTRTIDFVEEQDSNEFMSTLGYYYNGSGTSYKSEYPSDNYTVDLIEAMDEVWHKTYAYGNAIVMGPGTPTSQAPFHFFGDQSPYSDQNTNPPIRVGNFFNYANSVYFAGGSTGGHPNFNYIDTMQNKDNQIRWEWPTLTIWNNAIFSGTLSTGANQGFEWSTQRSDKYIFGSNWISSNWGSNTQTCTNSTCWAGTGWPYYTETTSFTGGGNPLNITGFSNVVIGSTTAPFSTTTLIPTATGGLVGIGSTLPSTLTTMPVRFNSTTFTNGAYVSRAYPNTVGALDNAALPATGQFTGNFVFHGRVK